MSYQHFTKDQRNEISILRKKGYSLRDIGDAIGKDHSSVSREISQNSVRGIYDPEKAHQKYKKKRRCSKYQGMKIRSHPELEKYIEVHLKNDHWTPDEISGRWNSENHLDKNGKQITISAPIIYKYLYSSYGQHLCQYLPSQQYRKKKRKGKKFKKEIIKNRVSIEERPEIINGRKRFGDWEGDTLGRIKTDQAAIAGLAERLSRKILLTKVCQLKYTIDGFKEKLNPYHNTFKNSLTLDNGVENVRYEELGMSTYFCHPYSSYEKGLIENSFGRLRRFIPKKSSIQNLTEQELQKIEDLMNDTPRKCLAYRTPNEVFKEHSLILK